MDQGLVRRPQTAPLRQRKGPESINWGGTVKEEQEKGYKWREGGTSDINLIHYQPIPIRIARKKAVAAVQGRQNKGKEVRLS